MNQALVFTTTDSPAEDLVQAVDAGLEAYNHAAAPLSEVRPLAAFASDSAGRCVGGAVGRTWGRCCELQQFWVSTELRHAGVGSRLLQDFEARGRERGCNVFYLTTLSFQAPLFYRKHGYAALAEVSGHPDGITKYLMHKVVAQASAATSPAAPAED